MNKFRLYLKDNPKIPKMFVLVYIVLAGCFIFPFTNGNMLSSRHVFIATEVLQDAEQESLFEYIKLNYLHMMKNKAVQNKFAYLKKALMEGMVAEKCLYKIYPIT